MVYTNWEPGAPAIGSEDCAIIIGGKWVRTSCTDKKPFFCVLQVAYGKLRQTQMKLILNSEASVNQTTEVTSFKLTHKLQYILCTLLVWIHHISVFIIECKNVSKTYLLMIPVCRTFTLPFTIVNQKLMHLHYTIMFPVAKWILGSPIGLRAIFLIQSVTAFRCLMFYWLPALLITIVLSK
jgi:hypothetical protein